MIGAHVWPASDETLIDHKGLNLMKIWFEASDLTLNGHLTVVPLNTDTIVGVGDISGP
jgi:hypothetical protein